MHGTCLFLSGQQPMYNGTGPNSWGMNMMYSPFGGLFMTLLVVLVVVVLVLVLRGILGRGGGSRDRADTPLDILKRRYAAGEIDREQFETMKRNLKD